MTEDIEFTPAFSVGVDAFDDQHRKLIDMINRLGRQLDRPKHKESVDLMHELIQYAMEHLEEEESLMRIHNYPELASHFEEHRKFRAKVVTFCADLKKNERETVAEAWQYLQDWLIHHILHTDRLYTAFFNEHGVH